MEAPAYHVHSSYVWLGGLKGGLITVFAIVASSLSAVAPLMELLTDPIEGLGMNPAVAFAVLAGSALALAVLVMGIVMLAYWLSWRCFTYSLTDQEFNLFSGVFSKKRSHVPYKRVQSVDMRASLLQRVVGVCTLEIDTAGGSSNKAILVPYLTKSDAEALRAELFQRKRAALSVAAAVGATAGAHTAAGVERTQDCANVLDAVDDLFDGTRGIFDYAGFQEQEPVSFKTGLSNKELLLTGLSGASGQAGIIIFSVLAVCCTFGLADLLLDNLGVFLDEYFETGMAAGLSLSELINRLVMRFIPYIVLVCVVSYAATLVLSAVMSLISYGGFQVRRRGSRVEVESGLLQRKTQGVDLDRVQFVRVEQGWIRRKMGYCRVSLGRIDSAAKEESGKSQTDVEMSFGMVVHPFLPIGQLDGFLEGLVPELRCTCDVTAVPPKSAMHRAVLRGAVWQNAGFWTLVGIAGTYGIIALCLAVSYPAGLADLRAVIWGLLPVTSLPFVAMAVGAVRGVKWHRGSSLAYGADFVHVVNEGFTRREVIVPRQKIQFTTLVANPFQLARNLRSVKVTTAAGSGGTAESIWDIPLQDAEAFQEWSRPRC